MLFQETVFQDKVVTRDEEPHVVKRSRVMLVPSDVAPENTQQPSAVRVDAILFFIETTVAEL